MHLRDRLQHLLLDPRNTQLTVLAVLLAYGALVLDFVLTPWALPAALGTALCAEHLLSRWRTPAAAGRGPPYKSAAIAACSTVLLFRSTEPWAYAVVAGLAIASKVLIRVGGRHFVNPTNGAVLVGSLFLPGWIASGQWGHDVVFALVLVTFASVTLTRAGRLDSALAFLGGSLAGQLARHYALGYRWAEVEHHFTNGALWLFALAAVTDPKTSPRARWARVAHGAAVAALATVLAQGFWVRDSFMWALLACSPLVPLLDHLAAHRRRELHHPRSEGGLQLHDATPSTAR